MKTLSVTIFILFALVLSSKLSAQDPKGGNNKISANVNATLVDRQNSGAYQFKQTKVGYPNYQNGLIPERQRNVISHNEVKRSGIQKPNDFINPAKVHPKHGYNPSTRSTSKATQYGKDVDVKWVREQTIRNYDSREKMDGNGDRYVFKKTFKRNISTVDTPTKESRVIINSDKPNRSTQFPYYSNKTGEKLLQMSVRKPNSYLKTLRWLK